MLRALLISDPLILIATVIMGSISLLTTLFDSSGRAAHRVARLWARILLAVSGIKVRVEGLEKIDAGSSYVFVSNHLSLMDTPLVIAHIPADFRFLAKKGLFKIPFIGTHLARAGHVPVPREDPRASIRSMIEAARILRERAVSILVFAEGGRSPGGLREFKEGAAYIGIKSGVPVVPMSIQGTREILPMGSGVVRSGQALLRIGDPILTQGLALHDRAKLTAQLRERIAALMMEETCPSSARS